MEDPLLKPIAATVNNNDNSSLSTYLSLIQQYLGVFMVDNATFLAERCVAQHPNSSEAVYLLALCYHRSNAPARAQQVLFDRPAALTTSGTTTTAATAASMNYLSAVCAHDLKDYARAEEALLKHARATYKQKRPVQESGQACTMDEWILTTTVSIIQVSYLHRQWCHCASEGFIEKPVYKVVRLLLFGV